MLSANSSEEFFEAKYRHHPDPWSFSSSAYEQARYSATIGALDNRHFNRAFEPGCSIGVLTEKLASFCTQVEAIEISATAAAEAQKRCQSLPNVTVRHASLPSGIPAGSFDLIVFSEIGYYFTAADLPSVLIDLHSRLDLGGTLLAVHWLGHSEDHQISGDRVHELIGDLPGLKLNVRHRNSGFRLDLWNKV